MALLNSTAFFGFEEFFRYSTEEQQQLIAEKRDVAADIINSACLQVENFLLGPVIARQYTQFYDGQGGDDSSDRFRLKYRPIVVDDDHAFTVKVREQGDSLDINDSGWVEWVQDTDFVLEQEWGILTTNPAEQGNWPSGFRNLYFDYWAGFGTQILDDEEEVVGSTVPADIKMAGLECATHWFRIRVIEYGAQYLEQTGNQPYQGSAGTLSLPESSKAILMPHINRRPFTWMLV